MEFETLKQALNDPEVRELATENARSAALLAREETNATVRRMDQSVQLEVAKAAGTCVELRAAAAGTSK